MKTKIYNALLTLILVFHLWIAITTLIQAFKCPEMTQTELFARIPQSFVLNWINC